MQFTGINLARVLTGLRCHAADTWNMIVTAPVEEDMQPSDRVELVAYKREYGSTQRLIRAIEKKHPELK